MKLKITELGININSTPKTEAKYTLAVEGTRQKHSATLTISNKEISVTITVKGKPPVIHEIFEDVFNELR